MTVAILVAHRLENIILRISIGKAIRHQHIEHVFVGEAHALFASHLSVFQLILHLLALLSLLKIENHLACLGILQIKINQEIIG